MLAVHYMELDDALHKLKQHDLDSVFVIREGYGESVLANRRNGVDRSLFFQSILRISSSFRDDHVLGSARYCRGRKPPWSSGSCSMNTAWKMNGIMKRLSIEAKRSNKGKAFSIRVFHTANNLDNPMKSRWNC